jgi:hypothetical protein
MSRCPHRAAEIPPGSGQRSSCERCASTRGKHRLHQAACLDQQRLKAPAPSPGRILRSSSGSNPNANAQSWIFLPFELSLGETRPSAVCLRSSRTPSLRRLVDIAYLFWFHSRHGWCDWLHELEQNMQANIMASRHVLGQLAEARHPGSSGVCSQRTQPPSLHVSPAHMHVLSSHLCRPS